MECGCDDLYRLAYQPWSCAAHSMWNHVARFNLDECTNPLHRFHRVPCDPDPPLNLYFFDSAAKYLDKAFRIFDEKLGVAVPPSTAHGDLLKLLDAWAHEEGEAGETSESGDPGLPAR
jgi:hypothetical protein